MAIIDVDTHFEPGRGWLADYPEMAARLPEYSVAEATMRAQVGELLAGVPEAERPPRADLLPPKIAAILGEVKVEGYGFDGSAMHPDFEPVWAAAEDLGMICEVHVGSGGNAFDPAWANHPDTMVLRQLGAAGGWQAALLMMNGMVFGGVFDRHPNLTLLFAEYGLHWFAGAVEHMEARGPAVPESDIYMGTYSNELTPEETVRRNVRITPLPRHHQPVQRTLEQYPECVVFSSDYAHNESDPEPTAYYEEQLAGVEPSLKAAFLGGTIAECFARAGDPLPV